MDSNSTTASGNPPERVLLALDPGYSKVGMALVSKPLGGPVSLLWKRISSHDDLEASMEEARAVKPYQVLVVGTGTRSKELIEKLRQLHPGFSILLVEEANSTMEARNKYWEHNPRRGFRRLLPASFWPPSVPLDDYAALVLAERALGD
jgi:RNase H-fold protein (predicted Holliday junction resolvase)